MDDHSITLSRTSIVPRPALILGWSGVLPFAALAIAAIIPVAGIPRGSALAALVAYGAAILAFMGGVQWGLQMTSDDGSRNGGSAAAWFGYGASVLPALVGAAAALMPPRIALWMLIAGFVGLVLYDLARVRSRIAPGWYAVLRLQLTTAVALCLAQPALFG